MGMVHFVWTGDRQDMIKRMIKGMTVVVLMAGLSACSDFRRAVGDEKSSPDDPHRRLKTNVFYNFEGLLGVPGPLRHA